MQAARNMIDALRNRVMPQPQPQPQQPAPARPAPPPPGTLGSGTAERAGQLMRSRRQVIDDAVSKALGE